MALPRLFGFPWEKKGSPKTPLEALGLPDPLGRAILRGPRIVLPRSLPVDLPLEVSPVKTVRIS